MYRPVVVVVMKLESLNDDGKERYGRCVRMTEKTVRDIRILYLNLDRLFIDSLSAHYLGKFKVGGITFYFLFGPC